jgi:hypothetical protein
MKPIEGLEQRNGDWDYVMRFLPKGWEQKAWELNALRRCRNFRDAESLLRTLLIHLIDGCSLRETAARAKIGAIADVSDVALLKRLNGSGEWFRWMATGLMAQWIDSKAFSLFPPNLRVRMVDASCVSEPGSKGTDWRLHYSVDIPSLRCNELKVSGAETGETFLNFRADPDCLYVGDRGYCHREGICHVVNGGGHVLVRMNITTLPLVNAQTGRTFSIVKRLRTLGSKQIADWPVSFQWEKQTITGRVCAIKKSRAATQQARDKILAEYSKKQKTPQPETLEAAGYVAVFTTLPAKMIKPATALEVYRGRWQIELVFKRLKSIIGIGELPKKDPRGALAWIHGMIFCAFLIDAFITAGERFSPWGFPLTELEEGGISQPLA